MHYRELLVWQRAMDLAQCVFQGSEDLPTGQRFVLVAQMQRAALSVAANIAEGHGRKATGAYVNHLSIAAGSLRELETQVQLAGRLGYMNAERVDGLLRLCDEIGRMLNGLTAKLRRRRATESSILNPES